MGQAYYRLTLKPFIAIVYPHMYRPKVKTKKPTHCAAHV